jgi:hypothetical protein
MTGGSYQKEKAVHILRVVVVVVVVVDGPDVLFQILLCW